MENLIKRLLEYSNINVIGGEEANVVRDVENKDYIITISNNFGNASVDIKVVEKIRHNEVSIYGVEITDNEIVFRMTDSNILMSSYIWVKETNTSSSQPIMRAVNDDSKLVKEIQELREENKELTKKYNELVSMMENKFKSVEKSISDMRNRNNNNNQKRNENNIPRVDIKAK